MPVFRTLATVLLLASCVAAADLTTQNNSAIKTVRGDLVALNAKECVFKGASGPVVAPLLEVVSVSLSPEPPAPTAAHILVELTDGSQLRCKPDGVNFDGKEVKLTLLSGQAVAVPLTALAYLLKNAENPKVRDNADWKALLKKHRNTDALVSLFKDRLNDLPGTVTEGKGTTVTFKAEDSKISLPPIDLGLPKIQGFLFANKADLNRPPSTCRVVDLGKNVIMASLVEVKEGGDFEVTTLSGAGAGSKLVLPRAQVALIDFSKGRFEYLSDLKPEIEDQPGDDFLLRYRFFADEEKEKRNRTPVGGRLRLDGRDIDRGLCLPAPTVLVYDLEAKGEAEGGYKEFAAIVGVDEVLTGDSHVRLVIEGDGVKLLDEEFSRARKPTNVRINVKDVKKLRVSVKSTGVLDLWNHLDIADAKVTK